MHRNVHRKLPSTEGEQGALCSPETISILWAWKPQTKKEASVLGSHPAKCQAGLTQVGQPEAPNLRASYFLV